MPTFVLLSKLTPGSATQVKAIMKSDSDFQAQLERQCPGVKRLASYALLGAYDFLHIFEAADAKEATKVALLANSFGAASTQTFTAIPFSEFGQILEEL
ncbi:MAG: GYD domain-containing protein [Anaerolineae bacterium]|nr:GYD domain-containing protein [Anaerolineae bacterium]